MEPENPYRDPEVVALEKIKEYVFNLQDDLKLEMEKSSRLFNENLKLRQQLNGTYFSKFKGIAITTALALFCGWCTYKGTINDPNDAYGVYAIIAVIYTIVAAFIYNVN